MNLKQFYIKNFQRKKAVIIYVADESGHFTKHWCLPERDNTVKIEGLEKAVIISRQTMRLSTKWNIPTFVVHYANCESINLKNLRDAFYNADELRLILDNDEAHKVFQATKKGSLSNEGIIILIALFIGFVGMFYFFNMKLNDIKDIVEPAPIVEVVESE